MPPPPLPIPPPAWLESLNAQQRQAEMVPQERPIRALEAWTKEQGQPNDFGELVLWYFRGSAWQAIREFYRANTALGREESSPMLISCFYYDAAFWPLHVALIYGDAVGIDPIRSLREIPAVVFGLLGHDGTARDELDAHWFDCADHVAGMSGVVDKGGVTSPLAVDFLDGADAMLDSAAASLLSGQPNSKAAEHARFAFESALKALVAERENLTSDDEFRKIGHRLDKLLVRAQPHLDAGPHRRLTAAHPHFPAVSARYADQQLPRRQLWTCYAEARHATATVLRALGGPDFRQATSPP